MNDTYGHDCGDKVLSMISDQIQIAGSKAGGDVCRWGGEEILMLIPADQERGREIAEKIRKEIENLEIDYEGAILKNTMTFGVSCSQEADSLDGLVKVADARLYQGKNLGKNQVVWSDR